MSLVNVKLIEGVFAPDQKSQIAAQVTDPTVSVEDQALRGRGCCVVEDVASKDWAIGGGRLTTETVRALAAGQPGVTTAEFKESSR